MAEKWIETKIWFRDKILDKNNKDYSSLLNCLKNIVNKCNEKIEGFHFFFEPDPNFLFRVEIKKDSENGNIESIIKTELNKLDFIKKIVFNRDYPGEEESYGKDGWTIAKNLILRLYGVSKEVEN